MLTRKPIRTDLVQSLRCYDCDKELSDYEITCYPEFDGMCEECYCQSMGAAFDDDEFIRIDYDE